MTDKIYERDAYAESARGTVVFARTFGNRTVVSFDRTVIFPGGGGQPLDEAEITFEKSAIFEGGKGYVSFAVAEAYRTEEEAAEGKRKKSSEEEDGDDVYYELVSSGDEKIPSGLLSGKTAEMRVNMKKRKALMARHTGEHILSYEIKELFGAENVGFHMNDEFATCDFNALLDEEQISAAERAANAAVRENRRVFAEYFDEDGIKDVRLRKKTSWLSGKMRVVFVDGNDSCTCCGLHVSHTGEIGLIKVVSSQKLRGGTRLFFICGEEAFEDYVQKHRIVTRLGEKYSVKPQGIIAAEEQKDEKIRALTETLRKKSEFVARAILEKSERIGGFDVCISDVIDDTEAEIITKTGSGSPSRAVLYKKGDGRIGYVFVSPGASPESGREEKTSCALLCRRANELLGGKGGGRPSFASGTAEFAGDFSEAAEKFRGVFADTGLEQI